MSGFLLDTNILVAIINRTFERLPGRIRQLLEGPDFEPIVSVVSPWEIAIKYAVGKLELDQPIAELRASLADYGCTLLPMTVEHALEVAHPEPATKDPFDRLLLAVCACEGMKLVTTDTRLAGHRLVW
ncbi:MAG: type II toxin-antitoxin system VapC family toxin [Sphingomonadales bacterium]|nr:type II toxin-antitoxin system VapC family toxin [Sphingomonadales bacterium]